MTTNPKHEFGKRKPVVPGPAGPKRPGPPVKRSGHVALLLMGTLAVGGGAYALMPGENCQPTAPGVAAPGIAAPTLPQANTDCKPRSSSSGGSGGSSSRSSFFSSDSSSSRSSSATSSDSTSGGVTRGGFGSFAHSFAAHFSGG